MSVPPVLPYTAGVVGVWLVFSAVRNTSPLEQLRAVLSGSGAIVSKIDPGAAPATRTAPLGVQNFASPGAGGTESGDTGVTAPAGTPLDQFHGGDAFGDLAANSPQLVNNHGVILRTDAAASYKRVEAIFGAPIPGAGWRSVESQITGWKSDPKRFGAPGHSAHPKGLAVDVDLVKVGASRQPGPVWNKLYAAFMAEGWCNPRGPYNGDHKEPWHFSYGGCA